MLVLLVLLVPPVVLVVAAAAPAVLVAVVVATAVDAVVAVDVWVACSNACNKLANTVTPCWALPSPSFWDLPPFGNG